MNKGVLWVKCEVFLFWFGFMDRTASFYLYSLLFLRLEFSFSWDQSRFSAISVNFLMSVAFSKSRHFFQDQVWFLKIRIKLFQDMGSLSRLRRRFLWSRRHFWDQWAFFNFRRRLLWSRPYLFFYDFIFSIIFKRSSILTFWSTLTLYQNQLPPKHTHSHPPNNIYIYTSIKKVTEFVIKY